MLASVSGAAGTGGLCAQVLGTVEAEGPGPVSDGVGQLLEQSIFNLYVWICFPPTDLYPDEPQKGTGQGHWCSLCLYE